MPTDSPSQNQERKRSNPLASVAARHGLAIVLIGGTFLIGTGSLYWRASADAAVGASPPLPVDVQAVSFDQSYTVAQRYAGRVEARQQTRVAFERAGLVTDVRVEEGDTVTAGETLAVMDQERLQAERERLVADRAQTVAQLELADLTSARQQQLAKEGFSSKQRYDDARLSASSLKAAVESIDAAIRSVDIQLEKSILKAPFDGVVGAVFIDSGAVIDAGMAVVDVYEVRAPRARIGLPPRVAEALTVGQDYRLFHGTDEIKARLVALRPDLDSRTQVIPALFEVEDASDIPFDDVVHFAFERSVESRGTWLPLASLVEGEKGLWSVYTVGELDGDRVVKRETVEVLHVDGGRVYVRGTLVAGARVLSGGTNRVVPGQRVALAE